MTAAARQAPPHGHLCWFYDDPTVFDSRARDFLSDGLTAGERVWYVADGGMNTIMERLNGVCGLRDALRRGAARIVPLSATYQAGRLLDGPATVGAYATATEQALAAGYTGLRVVADGTTLVRTPEQLDAFARYEHLIDRYMRSGPMSGLCGFDRVELGDRVVAELACIHPQTNLDQPLFRLYAGPPGAAFAIAGELDASNHDLFGTALRRAAPRPVDGRLVLDASALRYVDHRALTVLQEYALALDATVVLRGPLGAAARLVALLDLDRVRVEAAQ